MATLPNAGSPAVQSTVLSPSEASDADKDLLDWVWKVDTDVVTQGSAEDAIAEAAAFARELIWTTTPKTSENEETKEVDHG